MKTECQSKPKSQGKYSFNRIRTNSQKLANHDDNQFVVFTAFKFKEQGKAEFLDTWGVKFEAIKEDRARNLAT